MLRCTICQAIEETDTQWRIIAGFSVCDECATIWLEMPDRIAYSAEGIIKLLEIYSLCEDDPRLRGVPTGYGGSAWEIMHEHIGKVCNLEEVTA